ncbi:MAG: Type prenyl endopeptidase Rce1-like [Actinomycetota bacterium]|nr:Type prenyl endopeptidase Rce1-like [Actinomycetota bacterium]
MSSVVADRSRERPAVAWPILLLGIGVLLLRLHVLSLPDGDRVAALALIYVALLTGSLLIPLARGERAGWRRSVVVLAVGVAGVAAASRAAGRPVAIPFGPWVLPLSILAAIAEEAFFRRVAYRVVERRAGALAAVVVTAAVFAAIHVPLYGLAAFPVDLGAGVLLGWQRYETGGWTVPAATHAAANLIAVISR